MKNIIFFSEEINLRAGGPAGYIANLKKGLQLIQNDRIFFIIGSKKNDALRYRKHISKLLTWWIPAKKLRRHIRERIVDKFLGLNIDNISLDSPRYKGFVKILDEIDFDSVTCHFVKDALFIRNYLNVRNRNAKIILMSHSPEPPSREFYATELSNKSEKAEFVLQLWERIEKEAFEKAADILLFPSKEAIEPYSSQLDYFESIDKQFLFLPTGCCKLVCDKNTLDFREKYKIKTPYIISYIGRHNKIKGYDLLKDIAIKVLSTRDDVTFLIGGKPSSDIEPLNHPRWIELGFVNPPDVLSISDCFILPNRQTYFDLVLLEVMSMGVPVFASATGGNKSVYKATQAINLYKDIDECVEKINAYLDSSIDVKKDLKEKTLKAYNDNYTLEIFAKNYVKMVESL